jgi:Rod binding domain-containing protein
MDTSIPLSPYDPVRLTPSRPAANDPLWDQAVKLEAILFAQLLESSGVGGLGLPGADDGPERQFDSFLRQAQAEAVAASGTTGLARMIYNELSGTRGGEPG